MTFNDLEWPFHSSSVPPVWEGCVLKELNANVNALCTMSTLKSTSSALHAISAVAEFLVLVVGVLTACYVSNVASRLQKFLLQHLSNVFLCRPGFTSGEKGKTGRFSKNQEIVYLFIMMKKYLLLLLHC